MNAHNMAQRAYAQSVRTTSTPRTIECKVIAQISQRIKSTAGEGAVGFPKLVEALADNHRLWTILAIDVATEENKLPQDLRAQIFYLSKFVHAHTRKILKKQAKVAPLLEINATILKGLSGRIS